MLSHRSAPLTSMATVWTAAVTSLIASAVAVTVSGPSLGATPAGLCLLAVAACSFGLARRSYPGGDPAMARAIQALEGIALFAMISLAGALASYAVAAHSHGYHDAVFAAIDRDLGFDWPRLYHGWAARPALIPFGRLAYASISVTPVALVGLLALSGRGDRLTQFLTIHFVSLAITVILFAWLPVRSPIVAAVGATHSYMPSVGIDQYRIIEALRAHTLASVDIGSLVGLIGFPSFHTIAALVFTWAGWPIRTVRYPLTVLNVALLAATPVEGGHYLTDVLGGGLVAAFAIALVTGRLARAWRWVQAGLSMAFAESAVAEA